MSLENFPKACIFPEEQICRFSDVKFIKFLIELQDEIVGSIGNECIQKSLMQVKARLSLE